MSIYYNEWDKFSAQWLRNLCEAGEISAGHVDERSIIDVRPADLAGHVQCHFFAGIGGWPLALRLADWPEERPVWTASCPCQPFSSAGKRRGSADERHLWPALFKLVRECRPATIFGEQVDSKDGKVWLDGVQADLESIGYAFAPASINAAGIGAPQIRQRLYWVGFARGAGAGRDTGAVLAAQEERDRQGVEHGPGGLGTVASGAADGMGGAGGQGSQGQRCSQSGGGSSLPEQSKWLANTAAARSCQREDCRSGCQDEAGGARGLKSQRDGGTDFWSDYYLVPLTDGTVRRVGCRIFPLAPRVSGRMGQPKSAVRGLAKDARGNRAGRLKGYGNSIVPQVAAEFIKAAEEAAQDLAVKETDALS